MNLQGKLLKNKNLSIQNFITVMYIILFLAWFVIFFKYLGIQKVNINDSPAKNFSENWYYMVKGERVDVTLPLIGKTKAPVDKKSCTRIYHDFDENIEGDFNISFFSERQYVRVFIDNTLIDKFEGEGYPKWLPVVGLLYHIVKIPEPQNLKGKSLCIELQSLYPDTAGIYTEVFCGSHSSLRTYLFSRSKGKIIGGLLILLVGFFLLILAFLYKKEFKDDHTLRALGWLSIQVSCWLLSDCCFIQFISANPIFNWLVNYLYFIFLPLTFLYFVEELTDHRNSVFIKYMTYVYTVVCVLMLLLQMIGVKLFYYSMFIAVFLMFIIIVFLCVEIVKGIREKNKASMGWGIPMCFLIVGAFIEMVHFFINSYETTGVIVYAFLIFFVLLGFNVYRSSVKKMNRIAESETYRKLAFIDFQTQVLNRTAYYNFVENYKASREHYCIILFDMNNLKQINDSYGHLYGDRIIKTFSDCAMDAFRKYGNIYRIGGDEFITLIRNPDMNLVKEACRKFEENVFNQKKVQYQFTVAYGYNEFTADKPDDFYFAQKEADTKMYAMKADMKESNEFVYQKITDNK